jgi:hypothetical protein
MSETHSGDEEFETVSVELVSETPSEDDVALDNDRGVQTLQLCARLDALEACTVELLHRFDESKCNMDRYYHSFLVLETVVNQLAENQNRLTEFVQQMLDEADVETHVARWRGKACPHGRRPYRCRHCAGAAPRGAPRGGAASASAL